MFHSRTTEHNKYVILKSLTSSSEVLRIVFATIALGMGVHLIDVNCVVHYGAPSSIDDYFQGSGRGGRTGDQAKSVVFWRPPDCPLKKDPVSTRDHNIVAVRMYLENTTVCRRKWLLDYFDPSCSVGEKSRHLCCDVCSRQGQSDGSVTDIQPSLSVASGSD